MRKGFTLVELLVVIAIITILASIVVPRVVDWLGRARMAKAVSEIRNADLALTKMLSDADKRNFARFWRWPINPTSLTVAEAQAVYTDAFYELLRRGKDAQLYEMGAGAGVNNGNGYDLELDGNVRKKLGTSYMELGKDSWTTHTYQFYAGPLYVAGHLRRVEQIYGFRSYRGPEYVYTLAVKADLDRNIRGNPGADGLPGFPSAIDLPVYIFSMGDNEESNQGPAGSLDHDHNGFDDINNWDNAAGWNQTDAY